MDVKFLDIVKIKTKGDKTLLGAVLRVKIIKEQNSDNQTLDSIEVLLSDGTYKIVSNGGFLKTGRNINLQEFLDLIK